MIASSLEAQAHRSESLRMRVWLRCNSTSLFGVHCNGKRSWSLGSVLSKTRETQCAFLWLSPSPWQRPSVLEAVSGTTRRPWSHSQHRPSSSQLYSLRQRLILCGSSQPRSDLSPRPGLLELADQPTPTYTIQPKSLALSLATFHALARNSAEVMAMRGSSSCTMSVAANHSWALGLT